MAYPTNKTKMKIDLSKVASGTRVTCANGMVGYTTFRGGSTVLVEFKNFIGRSGAPITRMHGAWNLDGTKTENVENWPPGMDIVRVG